MRVLSKRALAFHATPLIVLLLTFIAGCAAPAGHPALDRAVAALERARGALRVRALAAAELDRAEVALEYARAAARAGAPPDQIEHAAYIVSQRAALAEARAAERVARSQIGKLQRTLDQAAAHGRMQRDRHADAPLLDDRERRALGQVRLEQDREAWAPSAQYDQRTGARAEGDQRERAPVRADRQEHAALPEDQQERALGPEDQRGGAPLNEDQREGTPLEEDAEARASLGQDQWEGAPLEHRQQERASVQDGDRAHPPQEEAQPERAPVQEEPQQGRAGVQEDQLIHAADPGPVAADVDAVPQDITLDLAQLPFEGAAPTGATLERLAALAERLLREPGPSVLIEAEFDLPDPEARTVMERRVEVVRAILLQRGIAPARLVVRAAGQVPVDPARIPSFAESPD